MANDAGKQSTSPSNGAATQRSDKASGQKVSRERGTGTNHKKNPGKRPSQGGNAR